MTRLLSLLLASTLLTACGAADVGTTVPGQAGPRSVISVPSADFSDYARNQLGGTRFDEGRGAELLRQARVALSQAKGFEAEVITRTFGSYEEGVDTGNSKEARVRYDLAWAPPSRLRALVLESTDPAMEKARFVTEDGVSFRLKAPGLFGFLTRKVAATDGRFMDARGHEFASLRPDTQFGRLMADGAVWTVIGEGKTPDGRPTVRLSVDNVPHLDAGIDREELELVPADFSLAQIVAYVGMRRVVAFDFVRFSWGLPAADALKL